MLPILYLYTVIGQYVMTDDIDDSGFELGLPTQLEMLSHQCHLLESELEETNEELRRCRERIATLVCMNALTASDRDSLTASVNTLKGELEQLRQSKCQGQYGDYSTSPWLDKDKP